MCVLILPVDKFRNLLMVINVQRIPPFVHHLLHYENLFLLFFFLKYLQFFLVRNYLLLLLDFDDYLHRYSLNQRFHFHQILLNIYYAMHHDNMLNYNILFDIWDIYMMLIFLDIFDINFQSSSFSF